MFYKKSKIIQHLLPFKKYVISFGCVIAVLSIIKLFNYSFSEDISDADYQDYFTETYSIRIPKNLTFAGEKVPTYDLSVREAMERELIISTYWQSQSLLLHKRANHWFPVIEPILKKNNIPEDFKYVALIESQLTNVVSRLGATGFWQLVEPTAKTYGLEITNEVDERYDVAKSTQAACNYFKEAYKQFNNWTLVAASYNLGMSGIQAQLDKQKASNYYDLELTEETARFVYRILAMKEIISRPKVYGYLILKKDMYPIIPTKKITIDTTIHNLSDFAISQKSNYKTVQLFNPWLRANTLTDTTKKKYIFEIPKNGTAIYDLDGNINTHENSAKKDSVNILPPASSAKDTLK